MAFGNSQWIGFDLDRTTARYDGWKGETHIGPPIPSMIQLIKTYLAAGTTVKIFTARVSDPDPDARATAEKAIRAYCLEHVGQELEVTCTKDFGCMRIYDDIARQVVPNEGIVVGTFGCSSACMNVQSDGHIPSCPQYYGI